MVVFSFLFLLFEFPLPIPGTIQEQFRGGREGVIRRYRVLLLRSAQWHPQYWRQCRRGLNPEIPGCQSCFFPLVLFHLLAIFRICCQNRFLPQSECPLWFLAYLQSRLLFPPMFL